jgi:hypothetical protein
MISTGSLRHPRVIAAIDRAMRATALHGYAVEHVRSSRGWAYLAVRYNSRGWAPRSHRPFWFYDADGRDETETVYRALRAHG